MNTDVLVAVLATSAAQTGVFLYLWRGWNKKARKKKRATLASTTARNKIEDFEKSGLAMGKGNHVHVVHNNYSPAHEPEKKSFEHCTVYRRLCSALDGRVKEARQLREMIKWKDRDLERKSKAIAQLIKEKATQEVDFREAQLNLMKQLERKDAFLRDMQNSINIITSQIQQKDQTIERYHENYLMQTAEIETLQQENRALQNQLWEHVRAYMAPLQAVDIRALLGGGKIIARVHHDNEEPLQGCA